MTYQFASVSKCVVLKKSGGGEGKPSESVGIAGVEVVLELVCTILDHRAPDREELIVVLCDPFPHLVHP